MVVGCGESLTPDAGSGAGLDGGGSPDRVPVFADARVARDVGFIDAGPIETGNSIRVVIDGRGQLFTDIAFSITTTGTADRLVLRGDNIKDPTIFQDNESIELVVDMDAMTFSDTATGSVHQIAGTALFPMPTGTGVTLEEDRITFTATTGASPLIRRAWLRRRCVDCPRDTQEMQTVTGTISFQRIDQTRAVGGVGVTVVGQVPFLGPQLGASSTVSASFEATFNLRRRDNT